MTTRWPSTLTARTEREGPRGRANRLRTKCRAAHALQGGILLALVACGGKAERMDAGAGPDAASGGEPGTAGETGASGMESRPTYWDDSFPWFDATGAGDFPNGSGEDRVLHLTAAGTPARAVSSTHLPVTSVDWVQVLRFSARGSVPTRLFVSVGHDQQTYDYFTRSPEAAWPLASVSVTTDFRTYSLDITELMPPLGSPDANLPNIFIAFLLDQPEPSEVWIDQVVLGPRRSG